MYISQHTSNRRRSVEIHHGTKLARAIQNWPREECVHLHPCEGSVFRCERASEFTDDEDKVLWLMRVPAPSGDEVVQWGAFDAPNSDQVPELGDPIFSSKVKDVLVDGKPE